MSASKNKALKWADVFKIYRLTDHFDDPHYGYAWAECMNEGLNKPFVRYSFDPDGNVEVLNTHLWRGFVPDLPEGMSKRMKAQLGFEYNATHPTATFIGERVPTDLEIHTAWMNARLRLKWLKTPNYTELSLPETHGVFLKPGEYRKHKRNKGTQV